MTNRRGNLSEYERLLDTETDDRERQQTARLLTWMMDEKRRAQIQAQRIRHEVGYYDVNDPSATPSPDDEEANHEA